MSKNEIRIADWTAGDSQIKSGSVVIEDALAAEELRLDAVEATLDGAALLPTLLQTSDAEYLASSEELWLGVLPYSSVLIQDFSGFRYGDPVLVRHDSALIGAFFFEGVTRIGPTQYQISATSAIGLLCNSQHYGGLYTGEPLEEVLAEIIGGAVEYTLDPRLEGIPVYGWLPVATRRDNLHQLLFAEGAVPSKDTAGTLHITVLEDGAASVIPDSRVLMGGSLAYTTPITQALVSEHAYAAYATDEAVTLYDGEVAAEPLTTPKGQNVTGALVLFDGPMHDLAAENGTILESGVNYAILGPSSDCQLTGKAYTHTVRVIAASPPGQSRALAEQSENTVTVEEATLVSLANSENVAARVAGYYGSVKTLTAGLVVGTERPGDRVSLSDAFGDPADGFISSMTMDLSHTLTAQAEILSGYVPGDFGNYYSHVKVIADEGDFVVPDGARDKIRAVLIGGGHGGYQGEDGKPGEDGSMDGYSGAEGGAGGPGGSGGEGGNIYIITIPTQTGAVFHAVPGAGGAPGQPGGASSFGSYSSASGLPSETGFQELFSGQTYGLPGPSGLAGGHGAGHEGEYADGEKVVYKGVTYVPGAKGQSVSESRGSASGGAGGGPAAGQNGEDGEDAVSRSNQGLGDINAGDGGNGATPVPADNATILGGGGTGGHGGGGGGAGGDVQASTASYWFGYGGAGGTGGLGGHGADGLILVYW